MKPQPNYQPLESPSVIALQRAGWEFSFTLEDSQSLKHSTGFKPFCPEGYDHASAISKWCGDTVDMMTQLKGTELCVSLQVSSVWLWHHMNLLAFPEVRGMLTTLSFSTQIYQGAPVFLFCHFLGLVAGHATISLGVSRRPTEVTSECHTHSHPPKYMFIRWYSSLGDSLKAIVSRQQWYPASSSHQPHLITENFSLL